MNRRTTVLATVSATLLAACGGASPPTFLPPEGLSVPAAGASTGPRLSASREGKLILTWMQPADDGDALLYAEWRDGHWQAPVTVVDGAEMFVNWADLPSVVPVGGERLAAHWLVKRPGGVYSYDIAFAQSADNGRTWSAPVSPHTDGTLTQHGFVSMFPDPRGTGLVWLDGRESGGSEHDDALTEAMTLRVAHIDAEGSRYGEGLVDGLVCSCCPTDVAIAAGMPIAVYRDRSEAEIRDIRVAHFTGDGWRIGSLVGEDGWEINACPVNGPRIVADERFVAVAWFTGANGRGAVKLAYSRDAGESFSEPVVVDDLDVLGRAGLAYMGNEDVTVSWLKQGASGSADLHVQYFDSRGVAGTSHTFAAAVRPFSVPQMARLGDQLILAWTEREGETDRVVSARLPID